MADPKDVLREDNTQPKVASSPFNSESADIILRTSDHVDFHVHRVVMSLASPFFSTMFSLKPPEGQECNCKIAKAEPVVVAEDSVVLDHLLRFCYPLREPVIQDLDTVGRVLEAALKYDIDCASHLIRQSLLSRIGDSALRVYAIACQLSLEDMARAAAEACWTQNEQWLRQEHSQTRPASLFSQTLHGHIYAPPLKVLTTGAYFRLLRFLRLKQQESVPSSAFSFGSSAFGDWVQPPRTKRSRPSSATVTFCQTAPPPLSGWSSGLMGSMGPSADTTLVSKDGVPFHIHRIVLELASAKSLLNGNSTAQFSAGGRIPVDLHSSTLRGLLQALYPPQLQSEVSFLTPFFVVHAAQRYDIQPLLNLAKSKWSLYCSEDAVTAYLAATRLGWEVEATQAARVSLGKDISDLYVEEMENTPAEVYQQLMEYRFLCTSAARTCVNTHLHGITDAEWLVIDGLCRSAYYPLSSSILLPVVIYNQTPSNLNRANPETSSQIQKDVDQRLSKVNSRAYVVAALQQIN